MTSVHIIATKCSNNDLGSQCCKKDGRSTGVSRPGGQGTGEEAGGAKPGAASTGSFSLVCRPRRWPSLSVCQASGCQSCGWPAPGGLNREDECPVASKPSKDNAVEFESPECGDALEMKSGGQSPSSSKRWGFGPGMRGKAKFVKLRGY
jgi:hypothetical protein